MTAQALTHPAHGALAGDDGIMAIDAAARQMLRHRAGSVEIAGGRQPSAEGPGRQHDRDTR